MVFSNALTRLFGTRYPIIQAGMVWTSGWKLASAVSNAGGLGLIGSGSMYPDQLRENIRNCRAATGAPFGVNIPLLYPAIDEHIQIVIQEKVPIVFTSAGNPDTWTGLLKEKGIRIGKAASSAAHSGSRAARPPSSVMACTCNGAGPTAPGRAA